MVVQLYKLVWEGGGAKGLRYLERRKAANSISRTATNKWKT
jgi:hypothetical protein